jgi:hypothetical protein
LGTTASGVSADGSVIVGTSQGQAFVWTTDWGIWPLQYILETRYGLGSALAGWQLTTVKSISADGMTVAGVGLNPSNQVQAWVAHVCVKF